MRHSAAVLAASAPSSSTVAPFVWHFFLSRNLRSFHSAGVAGINLPFKFGLSVEAEPGIIAVHCLQVTWAPMSGAGPSGS